MVMESAVGPVGRHNIFVCSLVKCCVIVAGWESVAQGLLPRAGVKRCVGPCSSSKKWSLKQNPAFTRYRNVAISQP